MPHPETWLKVLPAGLFCEPGGFFIDPVRPVDRAVITHGHSDHARPGHAPCSPPRRPWRSCGPARATTAQGVRSRRWRWHEPLTIGEVRVWLSPAGHVLGSAQVAME